MTQTITVPYNDGQSGITLEFKETDAILMVGTMLNKRPESKKVGERLSPGAADYQEPLTSNNAEEMLGMTAEAIEAMPKDELKAALNAHFYGFISDIAVYSDIRDLYSQLPGGISMTSIIAKPVPPPAPATAERKLNPPPKPARALRASTVKKAPEKIPGIITQLPTAEARIAEEAAEIFHSFATTQPRGKRDGAHVAVAVSLTANKVVKDFDNLFENMKAPEKPEAPEKSGTQNAIPTAATATAASK